MIGRLRPCRLLFGFAVSAAMVFLGFTPGRAAGGEPQAGQTLAEFQAAVTVSLAEHGDRMGYGVEPCSLAPPFDPAGRTYLARAFSQRTDTVIVLIAAKRDRVIRWKEFDLPQLDGWITHQTKNCSGAILTIGTGRAAQRYRWDGQAFARAR